MKQIYFVLLFVFVWFLGANAQRLTRAEYFIDKDLGPGKGIAIAGITRADSLNIQNINVPTTGLADGPHILGLRVRDSLGVWSATFITPFNILKGNLSSFNQSRLVRAEYFIDKDPEPGKGVAIAGITRADSLNIQNINVPTTGLSEGSHILGLRVRDSLGVWSATFITSFSILKGNGDLNSFNQSRLVRAEYFIDKDPEPGKGVAIAGITRADSLNIQNINVPTTGLSEGSHILGLRVRDSLGVWSATFITSFSILKGNGDLNSFNQSRLVRAEYFIDKDPEPGKGVVIAGITRADSLNIQNINVPTTGLSEGSHILGLRVRDSLGVWSATFITSFSILKGNGDLNSFNQSRLVRAEYFIDKDLGPGKGVAIAGITRADSLNIQNISIPTTGLAEGSHILGLRVRDSLGMWSANFITSFNIINGGGTTDTSTQLLIEGEYFFGNKDPGVGKGIAFTTPTKAAEWNVSGLSISIPDTLGLSQDNYFTFRIKQEDGLWSANQTIKFDVCAQIVAAPVAVGATICGGTGTATLKASGISTKKYAWFTDSWDKTSVVKTSQTTSTTDTTYTTPTLTASKEYWVSASNSTSPTCPYGLRTKVPVEVVEALAAPQISNVTRCGPGRLTMVASGAPVGGTYRWYATDTSKTWLFEGTSYRTDSLINEGSYSYSVVTVSNAGKCVSPNRKKPVATIRTCTPQTITFPFVNDLIFGFEDFTVLKATASSGLKVEYQLISGPARVSNDTIFPTSIGEIVVRARQLGNANFEEAPNVIRRFKSLPNGSTVIIDYAKPLCTGSELKLIATGIKDGKYFWTGPNGFTSTLQNPSVYDVSLADSGKYSLIVQSPSDTLNAIVKVNVLKSPEKISLYSVLRDKCAKEYQVFTEGDSIIRYQWYFNAKPMTGTVSSSLEPTITGVYSVTGFNAVGCGISSSPVFVDVNPDTIPFLTRLRNPSRLRAPLAQHYTWFIDNYFVVNSNVQELPLIYNGTYKVKLTSDKGCVSYSPEYEIFDDNLPSLRADMLQGNQIVIDETSGLSIVPQPAQDFANIFWSTPKRGIVNIELVNTEGRVVYRMQANKENEIFGYHLNTQNFKTGLYLMKLTCEDKQVTKQLLLTK